MVSKKRGEAMKPKRKIEWATIEVKKELIDKHESSVCVSGSFDDQNVETF